MAAGFEPRFTVKRTEGSKSSGTVYSVGLALGGGSCKVKPQALLFLTYPGTAIPQLGDLRAVQGAASKCRGLEAGRPSLTGTLKAAPPSGLRS